MPLHDDRTTHLQTETADDIGRSPATTSRTLNPSPISNINEDHEGSGPVNTDGKRNQDPQPAAQTEDQLLRRNSSANPSSSNPRRGNDDRLSTLPNSIIQNEHDLHPSDNFAFHYYHVPHLNGLMEDGSTSYPTTLDPPHGSGPKVYHVPSTLVPNKVRFVIDPDYERYRTTNPKNEAAASDSEEYEEDSSTDRPPSPTVSAGPALGARLRSPVDGASISSISEHSPPKSDPQYVNAPIEEPHHGSPPVLTSGRSNGGGDHGRQPLGGGSHEATHGGGIAEDGSTNSTATANAIATNNHKLLPVKREPNPNAGTAAREADMSPNPNHKHLTLTNSGDWTEDEVEALLECVEDQGVDMAQAISHDPWGTPVELEWERVAQIITGMFYRMRTAFDCYSRWTCAIIGNAVAAQVGTSRPSSNKRATSSSVSHSAKKQRSTNGPDEKGSAAHDNGHLTKQVLTEAWSQMSEAEQRAMLDQWGVRPAQPTAVKRRRSSKKPSGQPNKRTQPRPNTKGVPRNDNGYLCGSYHKIVYKLA